MKTAILLSLLAVTVALSAPTPTPPSAFVATSTVKFRWDPSPIMVPPVTSYDFMERVGGTWKLLGNTKTPEFTIANIGYLTRNFAVCARNVGGPGVIREFSFPGMPGASKYYIEVTLK